MVYLSIIMQLCEFHCGVAEEKSRDQKVIPGTQQLLVIQQSVFISQKDLRWNGVGTFKKKKKSLTVAGCLHWPFNNELPHSPCRWAPDVGCWRTSCPAGSGPPPRASASTLHQTLWASECHQAEGTLQKIQRCESARVGSCAHLVFRLR